jgi:hypothetical protein
MSHGMRSSRRKGGLTGLGFACACRMAAVLAATTAICVISLLSIVGTASAAVSAPAWKVDAVSLPSVFSANDASSCEAEKKCDRYSIVVLNDGDAPTSGQITLTDALPSGITVGKVKKGEGPEGTEWECTKGATVSCTIELEHGIPVGGYTPYLDIEVHAPAAGMTGTLTNVVTAEGGGAITPAMLTTQTPIALTTPRFEVQEFGFVSSGVAGEPSLQAGAHPWSLTTSFTLPIAFTPLGLDNGRHSSEGPRFYTPVGELESAVAELPLGLLGDAQATAKCTQTEMREEQGHPASCPAGSRVGSFAVSAGEFPNGEFGYTERPSECCTAIYNVVPEAGYPAEFAFAYAGIPVFLYASVVHTPAGYRIRVAATGLPDTLEVENVSLTFFGEPGAIDGDPSDEAPFLTNPTDCSAAGELQQELGARIQLTSWDEPENRQFADAPAVLPTGCDALHFEPTLALAPSTAGAGAQEEGSAQSDTPSAYTTTLTIPQTSSFDELATPPLRDATVTLPVGVSISPASGTGLQGCEAVGPDGINIGTENASEIGPGGQDLEDPEATELGEGHGGGDGSRYDDGLYHVAPGQCPAASTLGTVEVTTPLLSEPLHGHVYLAQPKCGGEGQPACTQASATNGELYGLYIEAEGQGVIVKLPGTVEANPTTGQITAKFDENPQFPVEQLTLHFHGGPRAPLANPQTCGSFATSSTLSSWGGQEVSQPSAAFDVSGCAASMPFAPEFASGTTDVQAGAYSSFVLTLARQDGEQDLSGLEETLPEGLLAKLAGVPRCSEAQASAGTCPSASEIGTVAVTAGSGTTPLAETGHIYLTGPYNGGPFGEVVEVPAVAGPFNLGTVVVRGSIRVNPQTAQATVVSDPFPTILDGVPLRLRTIDVTLTREGFTFNPTSCSQQAVTGKVSAQQGASEAVSSSFAVTGCASLPFAPSLSAATQGAASKANGASLTVRISQRPGEANIHKVDLTIPDVLPSRLTTLHQACTEAQFEADPAGCPAGSFIGTATALTPVLSVPLTGPAILVSHGSAAFPDVEFVLQGEGVEIVLDGATDIKHDVTYSKFETVPDAPISSFEAVFPEGPHSILGANLPEAADYNLCGRTIAMPTTITGQNGAQVTRSTTIAVTGCGRVAKPVLTRAQKLAKALKACRKDKASSRRARCEQVARKQYGPLKKVNKKK